MTLSPPWFAPSHLCAHLVALPVRPLTVTALLTPASRPASLGATHIMIGIHLAIGGICAEVLRNDIVRSISWI